MSGHVCLPRQRYIRQMTSWWLPDMRYPCQFKHNGDEISTKSDLNNVRDATPNSENIPLPPSRILPQCQESIQTLLEHFTGSAR